MQRHATEQLVENLESSYVIQSGAKPCDSMRINHILFRNAGVVGSNPINGTISPRGLLCLIQKTWLSNLNPLLVALLIR